jgi:hypothetical protein
MKILFPDLSYNDSLFVCNLERLDSRREQIVRDLFNEIKNPAHVLHNILLGKLSTSTSVTRNNYHFELPAAQTMRYLNSFITYCICKRY